MKKSIYEWVSLVGVKLLMLLISSVLAINLSACAATYQEDVFKNPLEQALNKSDEVLRLYEKQRVFMEDRDFAKVLGLDLGVVRDIEVYSMRPSEEELEYTLEVLMEASLLNGDRKCVKQKYHVVMDKKEYANVKKVMQSSSFMGHAKEQVAYREEISVKEKNKIKEALYILLTKDQSFFRNYERSWLEGYESWVKFISQAPAFYEKIKVNKGDYKEQYSLSLSPYSLEEEKIYWDMENISFQVEPSTTKELQYVRVNIPAEVLRDHYNKLYYNYEYLVVLNEEALTSIRFISKVPL